MKKIILASASPRRKMLLKKAGIRFKAVKSGYKENNSENLAPEKLVLKHAEGKAKDVASKTKSGVIIGADTIVVIGKKIVGKPKNVDDAKRILTLLSGKTQTVITGIVMLDVKTGKKFKKIYTTKVAFKKIGKHALEKYLKTNEYRDKAGAYAFQGKARKFIKKVEGSKTNVIGLPIEELLPELENFMKE